MPAGCQFNIWYEVFNWISRAIASLFGGLAAGYILLKWKWWRKGTLWDTIKKRMWADEQRGKYYEDG
jgi:hypothetical protein